MIINEAIIGIGSNINPEENITSGLQTLKEQFTVLAETECLKTKAIGTIIQPDFINCACLLSCTLEQESLKVALKKIEVEHGRKQSGPGPRTLDLDILIWNEKLIDEEIYEIPFWQDFIKQLKPNMKI